MPEDYQFRMTDLEYKKFCLKQKIENVSDQPVKKDKFVTSKGGAPLYYQKDQEECNVSELAESDLDINGGDREDNYSSDSDDDRDSKMSDSFTENKVVD